MCGCRLLSFQWEKQNFLSFSSCVLKLGLGELEFKFSFVFLRGGGTKEVFFFFFPILYIYIFARLGEGMVSSMGPEKIYCFQSENENGNQRKKKNTKPLCLLTTGIFIFIFTVNFLYITSSLPCILCPVLTYSPPTYLPPQSTDGF